MPSDYFALDLRRLLDSLQEERNAIAVLYSHKENRLLFANQMVKQWLGWNADKFVNEFPELVQKGFEEWKLVMSQLASTPEGSVSLQVQAKSGETVPLRCHLAAIYTGLFRSHTIGLFVKD